MSGEQNEPAAPATSPLQFDTAEFNEGGAESAGSATAQPCALCGAPTTGAYFEVSGKVVCPPCRGKLVADLASSGSGHFLRAGALGMGAALLSSIVWYLITRLTGYNLGIVSVAVGWLVGTAVARGSGHRGGLSFQALAVFLAYFAIAGANLPFMFEAAENDAVTGEDGDRAADVQQGPAADPGPVEGQRTPAAGRRETEAGTSFLGALVALIGITLALPVLIGIESPLSGLIFSFALWEAWKLNRKVILQIAGPFERQAETPPAEAPTT